MSTTTPHSAHRALYAAYLAKCNAHDFAGMEQFYTTPTLNVNDAPWTPSRVTDQFRPLVAAFPDLHWEIRHFTVEGDLLALHFKVGGTHKGTFRGIEATGRKVETTEFTLYRVVDGVFADVWDVTDFESVVQQIS